MPIVFGFAFFLTLCTALTGLLSLLDRCWLARRRQHNNGADTPTPWVFEAAHSLFPMLLIVWLIRSFLVQPYRVPSGSLEPTVLPGDFIVVNQFAYGFHFPIKNIRLVKLGSPQRGDIALFHWPEDPSVVFVKRVVGLPGDHIAYRHKQLFINGKPADQVLVGPDQNVIPDQKPEPVLKKIEHLFNVTHSIFVKPKQQYSVEGTWNVPAGHYFMMGDNRDDSNDSRYWGFVPESHLIGKAMRIWMSWDGNHTRVRWQRIGKAVK